MSAVIQKERYVQAGIDTPAVNGAHMLRIFFLEEDIQVRYDVRFFQIAIAVFPYVAALEGEVEVAARVLS